MPFGNIEVGSAYVPKENYISYRSGRAGLLGITVEWNSTPVIHSSSNFIRAEDAPLEATSVGVFTHAKVKVLFPDLE